MATLALLISTADAFTLKDLEAAAQVPARQIRELVRLAILPLPSSLGRGATYGRDHLDRLRAWKRLRDGAPAGTTNAQLKALIDQLAEKGLLRAFADGSIPFQLLDDNREAVSVVLPAPDSGSTGPRMPMANEPGAPYGGNVAATEYLASLRRGRKSMSPAARPSAPPMAEATLALGAGVAGRSTANVPLDRLVKSLDAWVGDRARNVRMRPVGAETWHHLSIGRDLTIAARGPLIA
jgi:hypothetical protein